MRGTARDEGFNSGGRTIDDTSFAQAMNILQNKSNFQPSDQYASTGNDSTNNANENKYAQNQTTQPNQQNKEEDSFTSGLSKQISDIYNKAGGITAASAKEALKTAVNTGLGIINKYSNNK